MARAARSALLHPRVLASNAALPKGSRSAPAATPPRTSDRPLLHNATSATPSSRMVMKLRPNAPAVKKSALTTRTLGSTSSSNGRK